MKSQKKQSKPADKRKSADKPTKFKRHERVVADNLEFNEHNFEFNGSMWVEVQNEIVIIAGRKSDLIYGMSGGKCVGVAVPVLFKESYLFPLMLFSYHESDYIELKYYSKLNNKLYSLGVVDFVSNMIKGTPGNPVKMSKI